MVLEIAYADSEHDAVYPSCPMLQQGSIFRTMKETHGRRLVGNVGNVEGFAVDETNNQELDILNEQNNELRKTENKLSSQLLETDTSMETNLKNYEPTREKTQLIRKDMNNISAMTSDSELKMASENTTYLVWSIISLMVITFGIHTIRK